MKYFGVILGGLFNHLVFYASKYTRELKQAFTFHFDFFLIFVSTNAYSINCSNGGINFSQSIKYKQDTLLHLNGVGSRIKFIWDVYVAALYLPETNSEPDEILNMSGLKQIQIHFLKDVSAEKLKEGWRDGFELNHSKPELKVLQERLQLSYRAFIDMKEGDVIYFNLIPGSGTQVVINGIPGLIIEGEDFMQAVLRVWLGKHPPQEPLKQCLLRL